MFRRKPESNLPAVSYTKVVCAQVAKITVLLHPCYLWPLNAMNCSQRKERATSHRLMTDFWIKNPKGKKKKKRNYIFKWNHIQPSQSSAMSVLTDGSPGKSKANNVTGLLKKKLKIRSVAAEDTVSQNTLPSLPPEERPCCRLPSLHLLLCSTAVFLWLTWHWLEHFLEHFTSQVNCLSRRETNPEK